MSHQPPPFRPDLNLIEGGPPPLDVSPDPSLHDYLEEHSRNRRRPPKPSPARGTLRQAYIGLAVSLALVAVVAVLLLSWRGCG